MSELRQDIATKRWVIVAMERAKRPQQYVKSAEKPALPEHDEKCPFCLGNEGTTPPEVFAIRHAGAQNEPGWDVRVVPNKFAALSPALPLLVESPDLHTTISGFGSHEVVVETPLHNATLACLPQEQVEKVLAAILQRLRTLAQDHRHAFVAVFRNHGPAAGTSLVHPHCQLIATPIVPTCVREEIEEARRFYDDRVACVYCYQARKEMEDGKRVVLDTPDYLVFAPFASRFPFELMILPKRHAASFVASAQAEEIAPLAHVIRTTLEMLRAAANDPDYNLVLHSAPLRDSCMDYYHWHIEILPRLSTPAGFELGTGMYITSAIPEETAQYLRSFVPAS